MKKILCLGNEFIEEDSLAKKVGESLKNDFEVVNIKDSFQLMSLLNECEEEIIILDVVKNLSEVKVIGINELRNDSILSAHDFDAGYVLKLIGKEIKLIGIPMQGDEEEILEKIRTIIHNHLTFKK